MTTLFEIEEDYLEALAAAGLADFDALLRAPAAGPPASKHAHRETVPLEIKIGGAPRRFFLKRVFKVPARHAIWPLFRFRRGISQPRHEWQILGELAERAIPAAKRVAYGERRVLGVPTQALLLVEAVPFEHTLEDWLVTGFARPANLTCEQREALIRATGRLIGCIHGRGYLWPDIHAKHIFATPALGNPERPDWHLCIIDAERMSRRYDHSKQHWMTSRFQRHDQELFILHRSTVPTCWSRRDFVLFSQGYGDGMCKYFQTPHHPCLRDRIRVSERYSMSPTQPDGLRHIRTISREASNGIMAARGDRELLAAAGIHSIDDVFELREGTNLAKPGLASYRDRIRLTLRGADGSERICYLKRYRRPPLIEQLRRMREHDRRDSSAKREAHFIKRLSLLGIPTMHCLAWGQEMAGPWERRSFIITEEIAGESLEKLVARLSSTPAVSRCHTLAISPRDRHEIVRQLALIARQLHQHRLFHRDLYLSHVFLTRNADGGIVLRLIDLARMIEKPLLRNRWVIKDLAALNYSSPSPLVTRADRIRFLYHYCCTAESRLSLRLSWPDKLAEKVIRRTARMARHDLSRMGKA